MIAPLIVLLVVSIAMPLGYAWRVWRLDVPTRAAWIVISAEAAVIVALVILVARWDIAGLYTRWALVAVFAAALVPSWRRHAGRAWRSAEAPVLRTQRATLVSLALLALVLGYVLHGLWPPERARALDLPLADGRFVVGQGGGIGLLNHHAGHEEQRHAADLTAVGRAGFRASGLLPSALDRYEIYGKDVVSPCAGTVVDAQDGLPDLSPPQADPDNAAGNHITIACGEVHVVLAHLQQHSVAVETGDTLAAGDLVSRVGNSGNTTEPHLHVHAYDPETGAGVPMSFGGRSPQRNAVFPG